MKALKIISGIALAVGMFLLFCVAGAEDYYLMEGVNHSTNFVLAIVALLLCAQAPFILNLPERKDHGSRKRL